MDFYLHYYMWGNGFYREVLALFYMYQYALQQAVFSEIISLF